MKINFYISFLFLFVLTNNIFPQGEANMWYFGNRAGLDFNGGAPVATLNGMLSTVEGCASISDASGNLLFYTDGIRVWNKTHFQMSNGFGLLGDASTSQVVIIQKPGSTSIYYIFTADNNAEINGLNYSEVDITLNAGLGGVTTKNVPLHTPTCEKITGIRHCNNRDVWVVSHDWNSNAFRSYLVTSAGVSLVPVISNAGLFLTDTANAGGPGSIGYIKASPNGKKLASATYTPYNRFELFDFDISTGIVSNALLFPKVAKYAYSVEFSPDGTKLYASSDITHNVYQFNLCAGTDTAVANSGVLIGTSAAMYGGALQLGPDKKIYVANYNMNWLGVINNPNLLGVACNYIDNGVDLSPKSCSAGLPNFVPYYFKSPPPPPFTSVVNCLTGNFTAPVANGTSCIASINPVVSLSWNFGDPASGANNSSAIDNPVHLFSDTGSYTVTLILNYTCSSDTIKQNVKVSPGQIVTPTITGTTTICPGQSTTLTATGGGTYAWSSGATTTSITVSPAFTKTYILTATNGGCSGSATIEVTVGAGLAPAITGTTSICIGNTTSLTASGGGTYLWSTSATTTSITVTPNVATTYTVTASNGGCSGTATIAVSINTPPIPTISGISNVCSGQSTTLTAGGGGTYLWSTSATTTSITIAPGITTTYTLTANSGGCIGTTTLQVTINTLPSPTITGTTTICAGSVTTLTANSGGVYVWNNGQSTSSITVSPANTTSYTVTVTTNGCSGIATTQVMVTPVPSPNITGITSVCNGQSTILTSSTAGSYNWSTGETTNTITVTPSGTVSYSVSVMLNGCTGTGSIIVNAMPLVMASIAGNNICKGQSATLTASGGTTYLWDNGAVTNTIVVSPIYTTTYTVVASVGNCMGTAAYTVIVDPLPVPSVIGTTTISYGSSTPLTAGGGVMYDWTPTTGLSCSDCANPIATPTATTQYCVRVINAAGCADSACVTITINNKCGDNGELFVPNGFSPNGDGQNDVLYVRGGGIVSMYWMIYDRWGEKIFETTDQQQGWDGTYEGKALDPAVFVYHLTATCFSGEEIIRKGNVAIIK